MIRGCFVMSLVYMLSVLVFVGWETWLFVVGARFLMMLENRSRKWRAP